MRSPSPATPLPEPTFSEEECRALETGVREWNAGLFFECHDTLEEMWSGLRGPGRDFVQGLIQAAVAFYHEGNRNRAGARSLWSRALARLSPYPDRYAGLELEPLRRALGEWLERTAPPEADSPAPPFPQLRLAASDEAPTGGRIGRRELLTRLPSVRAAGGHWVRIHRRAMACRFEIVLPSEDVRHLAAAREALDEVDAHEAALSLFRETSELRRVNREAARRRVEVTPSLFSLLRLCQALQAETDGAFDPTSTPLSRAWGFLERKGRRPAPDELAAARARVGMDKVELDEARRSVRFVAEGVELNLGSIGKGWTLDRIAEGLRRRGVARALLSAGGSSLLAWGAEEWEVALRPGGETLARIRLRDGASGTSGAGEQRFEAGGRRYGHVIDPRTGEPASGVRAASVVADEAAVADAVATAFLVAGPEVADRYCRSHPGTFAVLALEGEPQALRTFGAREGTAVDPAGPTPAPPPRA